MAIRVTKPIPLIPINTAVPSTAPGMIMSLPARHIIRFLDCFLTEENWNDAPSIIIPIGVAHADS